MSPRHTMQASHISPENDAADRAPAVGKAIQILRYLSRQLEPVGVSPLATALGIVPSTCLHILRALVREGLVTFDGSTKRYRLGVGVLGLARTYLSLGPMRLIVQPLLDELARRRGVTVALISRLDPRELIVAAVAEGADMFSVRITVGRSFPLFSSASGRCMAAYAALSASELRNQFEDLRWEGKTSFREWLSEVENVPAQGYAVDAGVYIRGLTVISAVVNPAAGQPLNHCVAIVAIKDQLTDRRLSVLIDDARTVAGRLEGVEL